MITPMKMYMCTYICSYTYAHTHTYSCIPLSLPAAAALSSCQWMARRAVSFFKENQF